jgi:hypothetical protein
MFERVGSWRVEGEKLVEVLNARSAPFPPSAVRPLMAVRWLATTMIDWLWTEMGVWLGAGRLRAAQTLRNKSEEILPGMAA